MKVKERPHHPVISPTLSSSNGSSALDIMAVLPVGDDIVNQMPLCGLRVHPWDLVLVCKSEECVGDDKVIFSMHCK